MPMGLKYLTFHLASYIKMILGCLQNRKYCKAIMDDLLLFTPSKRSHVEKLKDLLKALLKNGLKMSLKKCQLFRTNLQYMGNEIFIQDKRVCVIPLRSRLESHTETSASNYSKRLQKFCQNDKLFEHVFVWNYRNY